MFLTESQLQEFASKGFLIIPDLFTLTETQNALKSVEQICNSLIFRSNKETFFQNGARIVFQQKKLHRIVWCGALDGLFLTIGEDDRITGPVSQLLGGSNSLVQLINQLHMKTPNDGIAFDYHQDAQHRSYGTKYWDDILGNGSFIQTALALDPMTKDNGPLEFFQGSHLKGYLGKDLHSRSEIYDEFKKVTLEVSPGSLVLFHPFVIHGSSANRSSSTRTVLINGYTVEGVNSFEYPGCGKGKKLKV